MNLTLFFKLITQVIFHNRLFSVNHSLAKLEYPDTYFYCPRVYANDGFNVSLQINNGNYCESENGYRTLGKDWIKVEFGFPSENEELMWEYSEMFGSDSYDYSDDSEGVVVTPFTKEGFNVMGAVGSIPVSVLELVFEKHGGIDWAKSCEFQEEH